MRGLWVATTSPRDRDRRSPRDAGPHVGAVPARTSSSARAGAAIGGDRQSRRCRAL